MTDEVNELKKLVISLDRQFKELSKSINENKKIKSDSNKPQRIDFDDAIPKIPSRIFYSSMTYPESPFLHDAPEFTKYLTTPTGYDPSSFLIGPSPRIYPMWAWLARLLAWLGSLAWKKMGKWLIKFLRWLLEIMGLHALIDWIRERLSNNDEEWNDKVKDFLKELLDATKRLGDLKDKMNKEPDPDKKQRMKEKIDEAEGKLEDAFEKLDEVEQNVKDDKPDAAQDDLDEAQNELNEAENSLNSAEAIQNN